MPKNDPGRRFRLKNMVGRWSTVLIVVLAVSLFLPQAFTVSVPATVASAGSQELDLLRVEHYLYLNASEDVGTFHLHFSFPPEYEYQVPLTLDVYNDSTTSHILQYGIENDTKPPNELISFTLAPMKKHEGILLHFSCWVLVKNHDFSDLPSSAPFPLQGQLPQNTTLWLASTREVELQSSLIQRKAEQLRESSDNLLQYAGTIAPFIKNHRYALFVIELNSWLLLSQDARTTLLINGENVGRGHLACAFLRLYNVPARVVLANNDQGFWTQMHYMVEYYCPGYGWVLLETTKGVTPYATKHQVINRVCYPSDENDTKKDYIFPFMTGEERWLWIDEPAVSPMYKDCKEGSKSQMFSEANLFANVTITNQVFTLTQNVYQQYRKYLGVNLTNENLDHFQQAVQYEHEAITAFKAGTIDDYLNRLNQALVEYHMIFPSKKVMYFSYIP
jgi:hypothetical protein